VLRRGRRVHKQTVRDIPVRGQRVLVRADFNVPLLNGVISDDRRLRASLPTINYLREQGARIICCSHLGRPKGRDEEFSLRPIAARLSELLGQPVSLAPNCVGPEVERLAAGLKPGEVLLLENLRFHAEETANDPAFARQLAALADVYVDDAFGSAHRAHASVVGVAEHLPAVAGFLLEKEVRILSEAIENPQQPFVVLLGGAKIADKLPLIEHLLPRCDAVLIGGGMAYTFLKAKGMEVGKSLMDPQNIDYCARLLELAAEAGRPLELPVDVVVTTDLRADAERRIVPVTEIPPGWMGADIGPATREFFETYISGASQVIWNGPMGVFEILALAEGTLAMAKALAACRGTTIVGGGDSAAAVEQLGYADRVTHVSTGGGATLEMLSGKVLPGVAVLRDAEPAAAAR